MSAVLPVAAGGWGVLMALAPLLQIRQIVRRRSSADVSLGYLAVLLVGFSLWLAYGLSIANVALVVTNVASLAASVATIATVLHFRPPRVARPGAGGPPGQADLRRPAGRAGGGRGRR